jgi:glycosyltransferase involved in cell wall biosynthesis
MRYASGNGAVAIWNAARDRDFDGDDYVQMKVSAHSKLSRPLARLSYTATMKWLFERGVRGTQVRIVQNGDQIRQFSDRFDSAPLLIYSAVEMPDSLPPGREESDFEVLWVASIKGEKRPELFLDLARRFAGEPIRFVMAGSVLDSRYADDIRLTTQVNERFDYLGPIPYEQTAALFARASLFVNTSRPGIEGFPNSFLQAWAAGTPVLSIDCDPGGVIARHGLGRIAPEREMENVVRGYLEHPDVLAIDRERCFDYVRTTHSVEFHVEQLIAAIEQAQAKTRARSVPSGPVR